MGEAIAALLWIFVEVTLIFTGKVIVAVASFGHWRAETLNGDEGRIYAAAGALSFKRDGRRVFTPTGLSLVGAFFYVLVVLAALWWASMP